jgi:hypothetical protein
VASTSEYKARRSQRVLRNLPVIVCGHPPKYDSFRECAKSIAFNAHGALLVLRNKVELGQKLLLINPTTYNQQEARVVYLTPSFGGKTHVGVEFMTPAPDFWPIENAPDDWKIMPIIA